MNRPVWMIAGVAAVCCSCAFAQDSKSDKATPKSVGAGVATTIAKTAEPPAPDAGMDAYMQACMEAAAPGKMHEHLAKSIGVWNGKTTMWMMPGAEAMQSTCTSTVTGMMEGRFTKCEVSGEMPGAGMFNGFGVYGFDNVSQKFQSTWFDNFGTGMMTGTGELSSDGKTLTWTMHYNCPMTKKQLTMREVETFTSENAMTLEMFGPDPVTGKEFKMMEIQYTRSAEAAASAEGGK